MPIFFNYAVADGLYNLLFPNKTGIRQIGRANQPDFQLFFSF